MVKDIETRPALRNAGVYVIIDKEAINDQKRFAGKILFAWPEHPGDGVLYAAMWDFTPEKSRDVQNGKATGGGYDKESAALDGMTFGTGDREFKLDCDGTGMNAVTDQFARRGYSLQWVI